MASIRGQIIPSRGIRITTDSIPNFPEVDIQAILCDLDDVAEIEKNYEEIQQANETLRACSALEQLRRRSELDKSPDSAITKILRARQRIELLKIPAAVDLAEDRLAQGYSIGVFVEFRQTVEELSKRLGCPFIDGTVTGESRDEIISRFQANETRCLVLNSAAGGIAISLQDLDGEHPRFGIVSPGWSATTFKQLIGRFPRDGGRSKSHFRVLFAAGSPVEKRIYNALKLKLDNLSSLTDGDMQPENLKIH